VAWVLDCLDDICSDLSVFHRIEDASELEGPVFYKLAQRLPFYEGAVRAHFAKMARRAQAAARPAPDAQPAAPQPARLPPATGASLADLNARHGRNWFAYTQVPKVRPEGGD
jgi:hypothetical protein